jgi:DNA-binding NarL/FixJ family response regulator
MHSQASPTVRVAIIEDERDIREGLAAMVKFTQGYTCAGAYRSMEEALDAIRRDVPDVALVDIGLPGMNGIEGIRLLKERHPDMPLLMLTRWTVARRCRPRWRARSSRSSETSGPPSAPTTT